MRVYRYRCPGCGDFEALAGLDDRHIACACGLDAERRPYTGLPSIHGETVARNIPEMAYRNEAIKRDFNQSWGTAERSVELLRKHSYIDESSGDRVVDVKAMNEVTT